MSIPFSQAHTVRRYNATITDGVVSHTLAAETEIQGTVTPISERELEVMPEGLRSKAKFTLRSETRLDPGAQEDSTTWRLLVDDEEYLITLFGRWAGSTFGSLRHWKYAAVAMEE